MALCGVGGSGTQGQLGDNTALSKYSPVQTISGGTTWSQVASSDGAHVAAIKTDGTLWTWGYDTYGKLGNNSTTGRSSPAQTIAGGTNWKQVSVAAYHTTAVKTDGTLWVWGYNAQGQLGDNTINNRLSPVQTVSGGTTWSQVSAGIYNTAAIKTNGTLWIWGWNIYGALGNNTSGETRSSPVQTIAGGTNWKSVSAANNMLAIKTDGTLWAWGYNAFGQLFNGETANKSSPTQTIAGTAWTKVSAGSNNVCAVLQ